MLYLIGLTASVLGLVLLAKYYWQYFVIPLVLVITIYYYAKHPPKDETPPPPPPPPVPSITDARARAQKMYPLMKHTAFLLFQDLHEYLPGIRAPISLDAVKAPVDYEITANLGIIYHFVVHKGESETPAADVRETLETIISQRLYAHTLPIAVPAVYPTTDGTTLPGLLVKVFDLASSYRVDLVLANEAVGAARRAEELHRLDDESGVAAPTDPDWD